MPRDSRQFCSRGHDTKVLSASGSPKSPCPTMSVISGAATRTRTKQLTDGKTDRWSCYVRANRTLRPLSCPDPLYARGGAAAAYAEARRANAVARADRDAAEYWSSVEAALLAMISSSDASSPTPALTIHPGGHVSGSEAVPRGTPQSLA
jgi:hypothetical protein